MKKLSIIIPVYNERATIAELLNLIYHLQIPGYGKEIIIVEDNSSDGTREIIREFCSIYQDCHLILNERRRGKGFAVRLGFQAATGDILAIQDADLEYDVGDYPKLLKPFLEHNTKFVLGSRHLNENHEKVNMIRKYHGTERYYAHMMNYGGMLLHGFFNLLYGTKISDPTTMYKIFTRELYEKINLTGNYFELDWEIVSKLVRLGHIPLEIPIKYESRGLKEGKKVKLRRDVIKWLTMIIKCRLMPKSRILKEHLT